MSFFSMFDTAGSAMTAQRLRMNVTSSNLANADTVSSSTGETYRARQPVFEAVYRQEQAAAGGNGGTGIGEASAGVRVREIVESEAPLQQQYDPSHPMANEEGYIFKPNVNPMEEMANLISAQRSYESNLEVFNSAKQMYMRTLQMGR
ncbi:flagellar basal-body rod protein FlgC [Thiohalospira halophila DSM 15071]|uniref:Flagellar basal-body rod protein FlgC n=1 Tax=Thiohalospira halophila DSM 15071 TaxID=1123397 RepID=A0A1I1WBT2_9GAMM|nr:flagellar basal body rod protein FlgC [Thiohalospira halophila]SFD92459.1 flagellar basal-body rod protein FlgC [Thiohalospira halophila DSM 15071]